MREARAERGEQRGAGELDERVLHRDPRTAMAATTPERDPRQHGNDVAGRDRRVTAWTVRRRSNDRFLPGNSPDHDVEEGTHEEAEQRAAGDDQPGHGWDSRRVFSDVRVILVQIGL